MTGPVASSANGKCPACEMRVPFPLKRGQLFECNECKRRLRTGEVNVALRMVAAALAVLLVKLIGLFAALCVAILVCVVEWLTVRVTLDECEGEQIPDMR